ncbi:MAG: hypothetical protein SGPRY_014388, partial [Prymnesium sp.]
QALEALGEAADLAAAVNWLLDHGEEDRGGAVAPVCCPHLTSDSSLVSARSLLPGQPCEQCGASGENWLCLHCGESRCSRYVKAHCLAHWQASRAEAQPALGHHLAISLSDLSVWCYACEAYVLNEAVTPHVAALQERKFGSSSR